MLLSDQTRRYVRVEFIEPACEQGLTVLKVRAGDVHHGMSQTSHNPAVCTAFATEKFHEYARVRLVQRTGQIQGIDAEWVFVLK